MNLNLSWDLFILVFFAVVVAYSFIIGKNQTLKVILGTYLAVLCADGMGNLFGKYFSVSVAFLKFMKLGMSGMKNFLVITLIPEHRLLLYKNFYLALIVLSIMMNF